MRDLSYFLGKLFDKDPSAVEQNHYFTKAANVFIVSDLDNWQKISLRNLATKHCLFGATTIAKNSNKEMWV